jgi:hypothetical protein
MPTQFTMNADVKTFGANGIAAPTGASVVFDLDIPAGDVVRVVESPRSWFLESHRITGYIRSDGRMYDTPAVSAVPFDLTDPGNIGVRLLANTTALQIAKVSYRVTIQHIQDGRTSIRKAWAFTAPSSDITVDLAAYAP